MNYVKTVKKYVSGSDKFFDIFECTVDEVEETLDSKGRKSIRIKVGDQEYKGLHNKSVFEFLVENEGTPSFVVLWKSNKGNHMLTYAWELWKDYRDGVTTNDVDLHTEKVLEDSGEAFVYLWINLENDMKYLGTHKGTASDGYICSNDRFLKEYEEDPDRFIRTILAWGSQREMHELETILLLQLGAATGSGWYNLSNNLRH